MPRYIDVIFSIVVWGVIFILLKPSRIKQLLPAALLSAIVLFITEEFVHALELTKFENPFLPILGIPFFHLVWGAGSGIIFINFLKKEFSKKVLIIFLFALLTGLFGYISEQTKSHMHMGKFNDLSNLILDFASLSILAWSSEGLFGKWIYPNLVEK